MELDKTSIKWCISVHEDCFILANRADPNEMRPEAIFLSEHSLFAKVPVDRFIFIKILSPSYIYVS